MEKIYSKIDSECLLLVINRREDINGNRTDLSPEKEYLQCATKILSKGTNFKPHRHNKLMRTTDVTQEAWVFLSGRIRAKFYDLDKNPKKFFPFELFGHYNEIGYKKIADDVIKRLKI